MNQPGTYIFMKPFLSINPKTLNMKVKNFESSIQGFVKENFALVLQQHIIYIFICKSFLVQARQVHRKQTKINHLLRNTEHHKWFVNLVVYMNKVNINSNIIMKNLYLFIATEKLFLSLEITKKKFKIEWTIKYKIIWKWFYVNEIMP